MINKIIFCLFFILYTTVISAGPFCRFEIGPALDQPKPMYFTNIARKIQVFRLVYEWL